MYAQSVHQVTEDKPTFNLTSQRPVKSPTNIYHLMAKPISYINPVDKFKQMHAQSS